MITLLRFAIMATTAAGALFLSGKSLPSFSEALEPWPDQLNRRVPASLYACAIELGLLGFIGTFCNASGLRTVSALQGGIFLSFINVFTPLVSSFAGATEKERNVPIKIWIGSASALAVSAFALISDDSGTSFLISNSNDIGAIPSPGAILLLGAALTFSSAKVRLGTQLRFQDPDLLSTARLITQFFCAFIGFLVLDEATAVGDLVNGVLSGGNSLVGDPATDAVGDVKMWAASITQRQVGLIVASAVASGTGATWLQAQGQRFVPATEAQLIYSLTPIFSAFWAFVLLSEPISLHEAVGGVGLVAGAYLTVRPAND